MNKKILISITIIILIIFITIIFRSQEKSVKNLVNPGVATIESTPTLSPTPKTFKFDSSTDLEKELESINPQVLDSDFE